MGHLLVLLCSLTAVNRHSQQLWHNKTIQLKSQPLWIWGIISLDKQHRWVEILTEGEINLGWIFVEVDNEYQLWPQDKLYHWEYYLVQIILGFRVWIDLSATKIGLAYTPLVLISNLLSVAPYCGDQTCGSYTQHLTTDLPWMYTAHFLYEGFSNGTMWDADRNSHYSCRCNLETQMRYGLQNHA